MFTLNVLLLAVATVFLARTISVLLVWLTDTVAKLGGGVHKRLHVRDGDQPDTWLFSLLLGLTKVPLVAAGSVLFFTFVLTRMSDLPWITVILLLSQSIFLFLLLIRLVSALIASFVFGPEVHDILKSLQS
jgi:hypothetical protein